ncbi:uncharacterized protein LOC121646052 [Melanotaenia boesemani]|uniref:uncharacterized protein LOC121646052 n=1 Tax=Melanotaenia boesemani TaxID=1250792 RepID=UPI001C0579D1|nr:uncharacterized protein LOC121646052 [Melanotaenia boesemani]
MAADGLLGYVRLASRQEVLLPPKSEVLVWGRAKVGPGGADYCSLVEALPDANSVGVARTIAVVKKGRVPLRVCNPHAYQLRLGRYQKLGRLYHVDEADVHGPRELQLSLKEDSVVEVALVDVSVGSDNQELSKEMSGFANRPDLSAEQQGELRALLCKWQEVFARHDEDFGRTDLVQHKIHTGDAAPIRERIEETLTSLTQAEWFSTLDLASGYWQHLDEVFRRLWQHGLKLHLDKCKLLQPEVKFLGHVVDKSGVKPDPDKIQAVLDWHTPTTIKQPIFRLLAWVQ